MKGRSPVEAELEGIPPQVLDFFEYVFGTFISSPEHNIFSIEGFNRRGWFYIAGRLDSSQIINIARMEKSYTSLSKDYFRNAINSGKPFDEIARGFLRGY